MKVIIFGSQYGAAKRYAEELANRTRIGILSYDEVTDINKYDTIVYIGALYAGSVLGMKKTLNKLTDIHNKTVVIATVGLADSRDQAYTDTIKTGMKNQLSELVYNNAHIYHLRGGIDYSKLNFKHKTMMKLLYQASKNLPEEKKTAEVKAIIETYNKTASFVEFDSLNPIVKSLR